MKNIFRGRHGRASRWAAGITLAGFLAGGGVALASGGGTANAAGQSGTAASTAQLSALQSAANATTSAGTATRTAASARHGIRPLRRLGGMYGSFTFKTKSGDKTLSYERGTVESVSSANIVVRAADGTTMTWLLVSNTVVRDHGKSSTSRLSDGQVIFVGGPVTSGAHDARLVVIRSGGTSASSVS